MKIGLIAHPEELTKGEIAAFRAAGADVLGLHPVGGNKATSSLENLLIWLKTDKGRRLLSYARSLDLEIEYEMHAASFLVPREMFSSHPEYFREANGVRTNDYNFCVSSDEMLRTVANRAAELVSKLDYSSHDYYLWQDDVDGGECRCEKCRVFSASDQSLIVANAIATGLRETIPGARACYLAYQNTLNPPALVKPAPGVFLEYAPFKRDRSIPVWQDETVKRELDALFTVFDPAETKILEYWYDNSLFSHWTKPPKKFTPDNERIAREIEFYRSLGVGNVTSFACYLGADYEALYGAPDFSAINRVKK